jgi:hypothetical protein
MALTRLLKLTESNRIASSSLTTAAALLARGSMELTQLKLT